MKYYKYLRFYFGGGFLNFDRISVIMEINENNTVILDTQNGLEFGHKFKIKLDDKYIDMLENFALRNDKKYIYEIVTDVFFPTIHKITKEGKKYSHQFRKEEIKPILVQFLPKIWIELIYGDKRYSNIVDSLPF